MGESAPGASGAILLLLISGRWAESLAEMFFAAGIPHVVCCRDKARVSEQSLDLFMRDFFAALRRGASVTDAFRRGSHTKLDSFALLSRDRAAVLVPGGAVPFMDVVASPDIPPLPAALLAKCRIVFGIMWYLQGHRAIEIVAPESDLRSDTFAAMAYFLNLRCGEFFQEVTWPVFLPEMRRGEERLEELELSLRQSPTRDVLILVDDFAHVDRVPRVAARLLSLLKFRGVRIVVSNMQVSLGHFVRLLILKELPLVIRVEAPQQADVPPGHRVSTLSIQSSLKCRRSLEELDRTQVISNLSRFSTSLSNPLRYSRVTRKAKSVLVLSSFAI